MLDKTRTLGFAFYLAMIALFIGASLFLAFNSAALRVPFTAALWGMFVIRTAISDGLHTLHDTLRLFATIIAANAAVFGTPDASLADVAVPAALTALIIPAYLALIWVFPSQRPAHWGLSFGAPFWVAVLGLGGLSVWNFLYEMPENHGLALTATLCCAVYFLNAAMPISTALMPMRENWRARIMESTSLPFGLYAVLFWPDIVLGQGAPVASAITTASAALFLFALSLWLDRRAAIRGG